jgi:spore maturation protein CgeB
MSEDLFYSNLAALQEVNPQLVERLRRCVESEHIKQTTEGNFVYKLHMDYVPLSVSPGQSSQLLSAERKGELLLFGAGLGEIAWEWIHSGGDSVTVWDRDPFILRLLLAQFDWREFILSGRLSLTLGIDLLSLRDFTVDKVVTHPTLGGIYKNEFLLITQPVKPLAFIANGGLFIEDISDALREEGYGVYTVDLERLSIEEIAEAVERGKPQLLVRINHMEGLAEFSEQSGLPTIIWEIDPALTKVQQAPPRTTKTSIFTWRRSHVESFKEAGFLNVHYLPLASNPSRRHSIKLSSDEKSLYEVPIAFVGGSMADRTPTLRGDFTEVWDRAFPNHSLGGEKVLDSILAEQRSDFSRYRIPEILAREAPGLCVPAGELEPELLAGELAAAERRLSYAQALAPLGLHVWGDSGWQQVPGIMYRGSAEHGVTINKIYSNAAINLDMGRLYQLDIVTMRVFDVLACGGFVLAEYNEDLAELFKIGEEVESWRSLDELIDKCRWYLANPTQRDALAQRGYRAVCERHTIQQRLKVMLSVAT